MSGRYSQEEEKTHGARLTAFEISIISMHLHPISNRDFLTSNSLNHDTVFRSVWE